MKPEKKTTGNSKYKTSVNTDCASVFDLSAKHDALTQIKTQNSADNRLV